MTSTDHPAISVLLTNDITDERKPIVFNLWYFLKFPEKITTNEDWPFKDIISFYTYLQPNTHLEAGIMPITMATFLCDDLRSFPTNELRLDHAASNMMEDDIKSYSLFWIDILYKLLKVFTGCKQARRRNVHAKQKAILNHIFENDDEETTAVTSRTASHDHQFQQNAEVRQNGRPVPHMDLNKSIQAMSHIFPHSERLTGEETHPFTDRLQPIVDQMSASGVNDEHKSLVLFSLTAGKARKAASKLPLQSTSFDEMITSIKNVCLYDSSIQERRATRWNNVRYSQFKANSSSEDEATRACTEHVTSFHKDLPKHLAVDPALLHQLRELFKSETWCASLYERSTAHQTSNAFSQALIPAAANADDRKRNLANEALQNNHVNTIGISGQGNHGNYDSLVAFFAKTPPPHRSRRPPYNRYNSRQNRLRYNRYNSRYQQPRFPRFRGSSSSNFRCYGCKQLGHILRNCTQHDRYMQKYTNFVNLGKAAEMLVNSVTNDECNEDWDEVSDYVDNAEATILEDDAQLYPEFDEWVNSLLETLDNTHPNFEDKSNNQAFLSSYHAQVDKDHQDAFYLKYSIQDLSQIQQSIGHTVSSMEKIKSYMLIDTGAPKSICSESWLLQAKWKPVRTIQLSQDIKPFRFAGHPVTPKFIACLLAKVLDMTGNEHLFRQVVFVLPDVPIPFLTGLQVQRSLGFDVCLREEEGSHIRVNAWNSSVPLHVSSHLWLQFTPQNADVETDFNWNPMIKKALNSALTTSNYCFPVTPFNSSKNIMYQPQYPTPPWERDEWTSALDGKDIEKLHKTLRHPEPTSMLQLFRQQRSQTKLPRALKNSIESHKCKECEENALSPRVPRIALPQPASSNLAVTLDVMYHNINNRQIKILVMLDAGDMMIRLKQLHDDSAKSAFSAYFNRWISIFDSPVYTIVDRGRNLTNEFMASQLRTLQSQFCPIPTEAPWSIGNNERSHGFILRAIDKLEQSSLLNCAGNIDVLLGEVEMAWNFVQHVNNVLPHYHRFGEMPRQLGNVTSNTPIRERIALMELARVHTEQSRAEHTILRALNNRYRHVTDIKLFKVEDKVWFHRSKQGWRAGKVTKIQRPTIFVYHDGKIFPTHENRFRPHFGDSFTPPELSEDDESSRGVLEKPLLLDDHDGNSSELSPTRKNKAAGKIPISDLVNGVFSVYNPPMKTETSILTDDNVLFLKISPSPRGIVDSESIYHTEMERIKSLDGQTEETQQKFKEAKQEEVQFLLKETVEVIQADHRNQECEVQPLKWVLGIKRSPTSNPPVRYRARLVSASHRTELRHSVHGNSPTVGLHTIQILLALFPTWFKIAEKEGKKLLFFTRDVTKAFLQSNPSQRLVYYEPPSEYYDLFPDSSTKIWRARTQLYGDVEAGLYWNRTFVPWLCNNILDLKQSIYDPSLLLSPTTTAAMLLCTDDTGTVITTDDLKEEEKVTDRFKCRDRQYLPTDFKGLDISQNGSSIRISQQFYASKMNLNEMKDKYQTKPERERRIDEDELKIIRSDAGKLAWLATGTSPLALFQASVALQSSKENPRTVNTLLTTRMVLCKIKDNGYGRIDFKELQEESIHIRLYTDGAFQNLSTKHSQIGFIVALSDAENGFNIVHWHSARAPRRPHSTEESEIMALDSGMKTIRNLRHMVFHILKREVPIVCYIDNETMWSNLMNTTVPSMPEIYHRCREAIYTEVVNSVCLISGTLNPADAMTKFKDNQMLQRSIHNNICYTIPTRVFMLQTSRYCDCNFIPTTRVPMASL